MSNLAPDFMTVVINRADGGVTVKRIIVNEYRAPTENEKAAGIDKVQTLHRDVTPELIEAELAKRAVFDGHLGWEIVPNDYLDDSTDMTYRDAWKHTRGRKKPDHDMDKARLIQRISLRRARIAEFDRLDNDYRLADEANDVQAKKKIAAVKQKFRDVTTDPRIDAAQTVEQLKSLTLAALLPEDTKGIKQTDKMRFNTAKKEEEK